MARDKFGEHFSNEFVMQVGFGLIPGHTRITALGNNPSVDTGTVPEDIHASGGVYTWLSASSSLEMLSSNAADTAAGTGARTVTINGLDANYKPQSETVTLNGVTPVALTKSYLRVNNMLIMSAGSGKTNAGTITARVASAGATQATIPAGYGITRRSLYTVPAGSTLQIHSMLVCINRPSSTRDCTVATFVQSPNGFYRMPLEFSVDGNPYRHDGIPGLIIPEKTDFALRCNYVSANGTDITGAWLGVLVDNSYL